ncbi:MAG: tetratricopeptide repeat protein [Flavobacteriales bacterium]|nr:tetratricopeptide repeat protein [Flavobacteriales bacterium]
MLKYGIVLLSLFALLKTSSAQLEAISQDSVLNRTKLNTLDLLVKGGSASAQDYHQRGILNAFFADTAQAISDYTEAIKRDKSFDSPYVNRGVIYQKQGKFQQAENDFSQAIKLGKSPAIALNNRGFLYQETGRLDDAQKDFQRAIKLDPTYPQPYINLAEIYLSRKENEMAFDVLNQFVDNNSTDPKAYTTRADFYRKAGFMRKALNDLDKAVEVSGNNPDYLIERAKFKDDFIYDDLGAVADCDLAIQKNPNDANYYYQRSRPLYDLQDYAGVIENCEKALELDSKHVHAMIMKANVLDYFGSFAEAKLLYQQAISTDPDEYDAYKQLAIAEFTQGNQPEALDVLETYMKRGNFHKDILEIHGKVTADLKQYTIAIGDFSELIDRYPTDPAYYFLRGMVNDSIGDQEAACTDMLKADQLGLNQAHQYLRENCKSKLNAKTLQIEDMLDEARSYEQSRQFQKVISILDDVIKLAPDSSLYIYQRGKMKRALNDHKGAISDYLTAIEIDKNRVEYHVSLAVSYTFLDRTDDAIKTYKKAIKIEPRYAKSYYNLGAIYAGQKKYEQAIELMETSLLYQQNYTLAIAGIGDCYLEMGELDKACNWYKRAEEAGDSSVFGKRVRTCR